jgi:hypothetical protein
LIEELRNFFVFGDVAHEGFGAGEGQNQVFGFQCHAFVLIGDGQIDARRVQALRDGPCYGALVGYSEDYCGAAF